MPLVFIKKILMYFLVPGLGHAASAVITSPKVANFPRSVASSQLMFPIRSISRFIFSSCASSNADRGGGMVGIARGFIFLLWR